MKQTKFRPHWLLDDGTKIYADSVNIKDNNFYALSEVIYKKANMGAYRPHQRKNEECNFGILLENGSYMRVKWVGTENI